MTEKDFDRGFGIGGANRAGFGNPARSVEKNPFVYRAGTAKNTVQNRRKL